MKNRALATFILLTISGCTTWDMPRQSSAQSEFRMQAQAQAAPKLTPIEQLRALTGTWVAVAPPEKGQKPMTVVFKPTSGGSAVMESMFPGSNEEMINMFTEDGQSVLMTHYCRMGNQPRMRLASADNGVLRFEFLDGGNLKSRNDAHMDSVEMTIQGDLLTEKWGMYQDGKNTGYHTFEFKRQG
jgi:hypothetical protein